MTACASPFVRAPARAARAARAGATPRHAGNPGPARAGGGVDPEQEGGAAGPNRPAAQDRDLRTALIGRERPCRRGRGWTSERMSPYLLCVEESRTEGLPELLERRWPSRRRLIASRAR